MQFFPILRISLFSAINTFEKTYTLMICKLVMGYQVLQSVICKYYFPPQKNSGLKVNINKINTQINMK